MKNVNSNSWDEIKDINHNIISSRNYIYIPLATIGQNKIFLGKEVSTDNNCLMFLAKRDLYGEKDLPVTDGLEVRTDIIKNSENKDGIVLKLVKGDYQDVFVALINDVIATLENKTSEKDFVETFFARLGVWKLFLKNAGSKGLGPDRRRGLFGELYFLKNILIPNLGNESLKFWVGPDPAIHDIEIGECAVEVKTSAGNKSQVVHISNERQMDDDGYENLFLYQVSLTARKNAHPTLIDIIDEIRELLRADGTVLINFNNSLLKSGFIEGHRDLYLTEGYHVEEVNVYKVQEGFPRIIGSDLDSGIGGLRYTVDLSAIEKFRVEQEVMIEVIKGI